MFLEKIHVIQHFSLYIYYLQRNVRVSLLIPEFLITVDMEIFFQIDSLRFCGFS